MRAIEHNSVTLGTDAQEVAGAVYNAESLTTSDIREIIDGSNSQANHKITKLEEAGLAEAYTPDKEPGEPWPPKQVSLTTAGEQWVEDHGLQDTSPGTTQERLDRLEKRQSRTEREIATIKRILRGDYHDSMQSLPLAIAAMYQSYGYLDDNNEDFSRGINPPMSDVVEEMESQLE
jgi:DNA-binding MarR family transcriptional regulator